MTAGRTDLGGGCAVCRCDCPDRPSTDVDTEPVVLPAEWHGTTLVVPDDALRNEVLRRSALSVSTAQNITGCPSRYALDRLYQHTGKVPPDDLFAPNVVGSLAHEVLEGLYRAEPGDRSEQLAESISEEVVGQAIRKNHLASQVTFTEKLLAEVRDAYRGVFKFENPEEVQVASVPVNGEKIPGIELQLAGVEIAGGVPLIGFIDRATVIGGDPARVRCSDYKSTATSRRKRETDKYFSYGDQLRVYAMGFEALTGITPEEAEVIYTRHSKSKILNAPVTLSPKAMDKTAAWFASTWETHSELADTGLYGTADGPLCGWCPFVHICPAAAANGREAKAGQPEGVLAELPLLPALVPVREAAGAGGPRTTSRNSNEEGAIMAEGTLFGRELKQWEANPAGSKPNPAGYDVLAAFGLTEMAIGELHKAGEDITPEAVTALAQTFAYITVSVQREIAGTTDLGALANTRARGALRTAIELLPVPFGGDSRAFDKWAVALRERLVMTARVSADLLSAELAEAREKKSSPWRDLAPKPGVKAA